MPVETRSARKAKLQGKSFEDSEKAPPRDFLVVPGLTKHSSSAHHKGLLFWVAVVFYASVMFSVVSTGKPVVVDGDLTSKQPKLNIFAKFGKGFRSLPMKIKTKISKE